MSQSHEEKSTGVDRMAVDRKTGLTCDRGNIPSGVLRLC